MADIYPEGTASAYGKKITTFLWFDNRAEQPDGGMLFHPLPAPSDEDIARLARAVQMRFGEGRMVLKTTTLRYALDDFPLADLVGHYFNLVIVGVLWLGFLFYAWSRGAADGQLDADRGESVRA